MPYARLTHPTRPTLALEQTQQDLQQTQAVGSKASSLGTGRTPLIHTETREQTRTVRGLVTASARADRATTNDWEQALSDYAQALEARVDEFQGEGYTLEDDLRDESVPAIFDSVTWTLRGGRPFEIEYEASFQIGEGVFDSEPLDTAGASVQTGMTTAATVNGQPLPGLRQMQVTAEIEVDLQALYDESSADNNQIVAASSTQRVVQFDGTHTGTYSDRAIAEKGLKSLIGTEVVTFQTRFPGYAIEGKVMGYESDFQQSLGDQQHDFTLRFEEGREA